MTTKYDAAHERCLNLTGDAWCPYMSELFMNAILKADDETAKRLIEDRRGFLFPGFLGKDPQYKELTRILESK